MKTTFISTVISTLVIAVHGLLPINEDRFLTDDSTDNIYKVASVQSGISRDSYSSSSSVKKYSTQHPLTSSNSTTSTVLNLKPGLSLLETDSNNECYFVNTTIGTEEYQLIIDTGSAYLWVYGSDCDDAPCQEEALYTVTSSESSTATFALAYVTGTASGDVVEDNIIVNKLATTEKFKFGKASTVPDFFERYPVSGIFGLPSNDSTSIESIISALYDSNAIDVKRFSISLGQLNEYDDTYSNAGLFAIGEPIEELYQGEIYYTDLIPNKSLYWLIAIDQVMMDQEEVNFTDNVEINSQNSTVSRKAIIDSGTTVLALPKQDALDVHSFFDDSVTDGTNFAIFCNSTIALVLSINGKNWTIGPTDYLGDEYSETSAYAGYCVSNIQGVNTTDSWILGAVFLKGVYADFDVEDQRIGFAERNTNVILTSTSTTHPAASTSTVASNSTVITSSISATSSKASSSSYKDAGNIVEVSGFSLFSIITSVITMCLM